MAVGGSARLGASCTATGASRATEAALLITWVSRVVPMNSTISDP